MYSRSRAVSTEERYADNIPPVYGGSRFYRAADTGVRAEVLVDRHTAPEKEDIFKESETDEIRHCSDTDRAEVFDPAPSAQTVALSESCGGGADDCRGDSAHSERSKLPVFSLLDMGSEEILLIVLLLLLCGEQDRPGDMIAVLLLLIVMR